MPLCRLKHWTETNPTVGAASVPVVEAAKDMGEDHHLTIHTPHVAVAEPASAVPGESAKAVLIATCILVDAMAPLLQEQASKSFPGYFMVLAETVTYFFGGLSLAIMREGLTGMRRCLRPWRYLSFMPASLAFSWAGFMTYPAIKGFGASQFYLLAQLRVAIIAVFMRIASQIQQPVSVWISLLQLVLGMVVLVWYKAGAVAGEVGCHFLPHEALKAGAESADSQGPPIEDAQAETDHMTFVISFAAMIGVIVTSAFGTLYLERQLKSSKKDPLFIQLHQLNAVGLTGAILVAMQSMHKAPNAEEELSGIGGHIPCCKSSSDQGCPECWLCRCPRRPEWQRLETAGCSHEGADRRDCHRPVHADSSSGTRPEDGRHRYGPADDDAAQCSRICHGEAVFCRSRCHAPGGRQFVASVAQAAALALGDAGPANSQSALSSLKPLCVTFAAAVV